MCSYLLTVRNDLRERIAVWHNDAAGFAVSLVFGHLSNRCIFISISGRFSQAASHVVGHTGAILELLLLHVHCHITKWFQFMDCVHLYIRTRCNWWPMLHSHIPSFGEGATIKSTQILTGNGNNRWIDWHRYWRIHSDYNSQYVVWNFFCESIMILFLSWF